ncbi:MAG: hypothetical protein K2M06_07180 [Muribaculaceae bacterium]|nr:hypothetical protein [Muribaculaceae bacterium]
MRRLHIFYPQNDLALAQNLENYTAPAAATVLARSGAGLPMWYGEGGDEFVSEGVNARWLNEMRDTFGCEVSPWRHETEGIMPAPWGWSRASRRYFRRLGFGGDAMPDDCTLDRLRELSGRRSACILGRALAAEGLMPEAMVAEEIRNEAEAREYTLRHPDALFKLPWSSSGRGQIRVNGECDFEARRQAIAGALRRYGFLTAEPFHRKKIMDFAHLFEANGGKVEYAGLSIFKTADNGDYAGNVLASEEMLRAMLEGGDAETGAQLEAIADVQCRALEALLDGDYEGPLGVDMMTVEGDDGGRKIVACVELNLRMTMGHVARRLHEHYCEPGSMGRFYIEGGATGRAGEAETKDGRLRRGLLRLNPTEYATGFFAEVGETGGFSVCLTR